MLLSETVWIACPYCGERIEVVVDLSVASQEYVEDCSVCCRPMVLDVAVSDGETAAVTARREDD